MDHQITNAAFEMPLTRSNQFGLKHEQTDVIFVPEAQNFEKSHKNSSESVFQKSVQLMQHKIQRFS